MAARVSILTSSKVLAILTVTGNNRRVFAMFGIDTLIELIRNHRYLAMFGILLISAMGVPIPEEPILIASGLAVGWGQANFWGASLACVLGIVAGDVFVYTMGRHCAHWFLKIPPFRWVFPPHRQEKIRLLYEKHGNKTVFIGRFIPAVRFGVFVFAGQHRMHFGRFLALDIPGAMIQGPATILVAVIAAKQLGDPDQAVVLAKSWLNEGYIWLYSGIGILLTYFFVRWAVKKRASGEAESDATS